MKLKNSFSIGLFLALALVLVWVWHPSFSSAADVTVSEVHVTVCGDGVMEGPEQCDPGKHCANNNPCTSDADCMGIGDGLCKVRPFGNCSALCTIVVGGGRAPEPTTVSLTTITVRPEQRSVVSGNNYDTDFYFKIFTADNLNHQVVFDYPSMLTANNSGMASPYFTLPESVVPGVYDILLKSKSHLAKLQNNVYLQVGDNSINFTNPDNGTSIGSATLTAGDIDGNGSSSTTIGDNVINAVDLSIILSQVGSLDLSGNGLRANLNQDTVVDEQDLNVLLGNLDKEGDR